MNPVPQQPTVSADGANTTPPVYPAALIATALGRSKRAIWAALANVRPSGTVTNRGQAAGAWSFCALPVLMQRQIENAAQARGYRNAEAMLASCELPAAATPATPSACKDSLFADLAATFADHIADRKALSREDKEWAWKEICLEYQALIAAGSASGRGVVKKGLLEFVLREVPGLLRESARKPLAALRRDFERKWVAFQKSGVDGLRDGRHARSGNYREILCPNCWKKYVALAGLNGGNESGAWFELKESGEMCERCRDRHHFAPRHDKSAVPHSIRNKVTPLVDAAKPWLKSDAAGRMAGPSTPRDWSDTRPGDYFVGDDVTFNHEVWDYDEHGKLIIFRPECLYYADERTGYPLDHLAIAGHYNGRHVRRLMLNICQKLGLPHIGWKHENGVWRSRMVRDESRKGWVDFRETEQGFKANGIPLFKMRFARPRNPRSKTVEGEFRILQEMMRTRMPAFVGFNEREERSDASKDLKRRVLAGKEDARNYCLSFEQWEKRISKVFEEFANTVQNGARNPGRTPREGWDEAFNHKQLRALPEDMLWLLATYNQLKTVTPRGIVLDFGKHEKWTFADGQLARFIGQQVWVLYHIDCPGLVTIRNHKETEHFAMKGIRCLANTAGKSLSEAQRQIGAFNRVPKVIAGTIKHERILTITRDTDFSRAERDFGREVKADKAQSLETDRRATDARTARQKDGRDLIREALMEAGERTESERLTP